MAHDELDPILADGHRDPKDLVDGVQDRAGRAHHLDATVVSLLLDPELRAPHPEHSMAGVFVSAGQHEGEAVARDLDGCGKIWVSVRRERPINDERHDLRFELEQSVAPCTPCLLLLLVGTKVSGSHVPAVTLELDPESRRARIGMYFPRQSSRLELAGDLANDVEPAGRRRCLKRLDECSLRRVCGRAAFRFGASCTVQNRRIRRKLGARENGLFSWQTGALARRFAPFLESFRIPLSPPDITQEFGFLNPRDSLTSRAS